MNMFNQYFQEFKNEVHAVITSYLFWKTIQNRASNEEEVLGGLNKSPLSWNIITHSLQVTIFITLGRIFDIDSKAFSADVLLKTCIAEIDIFSLENLHERKSKSISGEDLENYMAGASEASKKDFERLRGELSKQRKIFQEVYRPIRHLVIAHKDKEHLDNNEELWKATNIGELESILWFLDCLKDVIFNIYHNGRIEQTNTEKPNTEFYEKDFNKLLDIIST